jgi:hypothetical protein
MSPKEAEWQEESLHPWSEDLEGYYRNQQFLNVKDLLLADGPYCPIRDKREKIRERECPLCGTKYTPVLVPQGYRWRKRDEEFCYPGLGKYQFRCGNISPRDKGFRYWAEDVCDSVGCRSLASYFVDRKWRNKNTVLQRILIEVINHANSNQNVRRAAKDFVRYARPVFEGRDHSAGCQSGSQDIRQYLEIGGDRLGA